MQNDYTGEKAKPRLFKKADLILYAIALFFVLCLFLIPILTCNSESITGFDVYKDGEIVFSLSFDKPNDFFIKQDKDDVIEVAITEKEATVKIFTDSQKTDYNVITASLNEKWVKCTESTCSIKKDCVHFAPITNGNGVIVCAPHNIKILPKGNSYLPVVTG